MLSGADILRHRMQGSVIIEPFDLRNLCPNGYDVTLGRYHYREMAPLGQSRECIFIGTTTQRGLRPSTASNDRIFDPYDADSVARVWSLREAVNGVILVEPGETILAHTEEFVGSRSAAVPMMAARSSIGRCFIEVCKCAGIGDLGYFNRWTMEITNNSRFHALRLRVGYRVAQMVFFELSGAPTSGYVERGKYQDTSDLDELMRAWAPEMMLPRLHLDREITT